MTDTQIKLRALLRAAGCYKNPDPDAAGILADLLDDLGQGDLATKIREKEDLFKSLQAYQAHLACLERGLLRWEDEPSYRKADAYHRAMDKLDLATVPVVTRDSGTSRKQLAALIRQLLRRLKIPHVSVATPSYVPSRVDVLLPAYPYKTEPMEYDTVRDVERFNGLLLVAFPAHGSETWFFTTHHYVWRSWQVQSEWDL
jgi:hypothetical protein